MSQSLITLLAALALASCSPAPAPRAAFRPVVAEALRELEGAVPSAPATGVSDHVRIAVAEILAVLDSPAAAAVLVYHATSNPVSWVRAQCAWRLASTTQDQSVLPLLEALPAERDPETRAYVASTLAHFGCPTFGPAAAVAPPSKRLALVVWKRIAVLRDELPASDRDALVTALGSLPTACAESLAEALQDENVHVRAAAARALEKMGPRAHVSGPALLERLIDDPGIELEAVSALGAVHHVPAAPVIAERLADRTRPLAVRVASARVLEQLETPIAVEPLVEAQGASEPLELRVAAAGALCAYGRADIAVPTLSLALAKGPPHSERALDALERWLSARERGGNARARSILAEREKWRASPGLLAEAISAGWKELLP